MSNAIDHTHDPALRSWVESANDAATDFPIQNLPLCRYSPGDDPNLVLTGVLIGDRVFDLGGLRDARLLDDLPGISTQEQEDWVWWDLSWLVSCPSAARRALRARLSELFREDNRSLRDNPHLLNAAMRYQRDVTFAAPTTITNYTDFYASIHHASTVGAMFRPDNPLLPNYKHVPIGYHGRASSIVPTGTAVKRPKGQQSPPDGEVGAGPTFGPCKLLDYELEVGCIIAGDNAIGEPTPISHAHERIAGLCLVNDGSARDVL